jgi:hypothetical protein
VTDEVAQPCARGSLADQRGRPSSGRSRSRRGVAGSGRALGCRQLEDDRSQHLSQSAAVAVFDGYRRIRTRPKTSNGRSSLPSSSVQPPDNRARGLCESISPVTQRWRTLSHRDAADPHSTGRALSALDQLGGRGGAGKEPNDRKCGCLILAAINERLATKGQKVGATFELFDLM